MDLQMRTQGVDEYKEEIKRRKPRFHQEFYSVLLPETGFLTTNSIGFHSNSSFTRVLNDLLKYKPDSLVLK